MDHVQLVVLGLADHLERVADAETRRQAPWRKRFKGLDEFSDDALCGNQEEGTPELPLLAGKTGAGPLRIFKGICSEIDNAREAMRDVVCIPNVFTLLFLSQKRDLPFVVAEGGVVTIVGDVVKFLARAWPFTREQCRLVITVQMDLVGLALPALWP